MIPAMEEINQDMANIVTRTRQSLVQVRNGRAGNGAGVIWSADGLILTNAHVARRRKVEIFLADGSNKPARTIAHARDHDLALMRVEADNLPPIKTGDSQSLRAGEWVFALGHPWGVTGAVSGGVVIGSGAHLPENPMRGREWVAVGLALRPGHSGGPLVNSSGLVIGLNTIMSGPSVGLAVPIHVAHAFIERALRKETRKAA
jgi:serine protease Do